MRSKGFLWFWMVVFSLGFLFPVSANAQKKQTFCFAWIPYGKHVGFYTALDKGFWKEEGLEVNMIRGVSGMDNAKRVTTGVCDVASGGVDTLVIGRSQGVKVRAIGVWHTKSMHVIFARKDKGINTPKDLEGKSIATVADEDGYVLFPAFADLAGVNAKKVKWTFMEPASKTASWVSGSTDGEATFVTVGPNVYALAKKSNVPVVAFVYADFGLDLYSNGFLATEKRIAQDGDTLRRFMRGAIRGLAYGIEHPKESVDIFIKHKPEVNKRLATQHWKIAVDFLITPDIEKNGIGHISAEKMKFTRDTIAKYRNIKNVEPVEAYYTNEFLPKPPILPKRPKM